MRTTQPISGCEEKRIINLYEVHSIDTLEVFDTAASVNYLTSIVLYYFVAPWNLITILRLQSFLCYYCQTSEHIITLTYSMAKISMPILRTSTERNKTTC